ncbi:MAG TPA: hypothetical protein VF712_00405 [Thermoleophilaceae bacterium]|jgi:hypothetical protein
MTTTIELDDAAPEPVPLAVEQRVTLGAVPPPAGAPDGPSALNDRIALGRPVCRALDPATLEGDAVEFLEGRPDSAFWLLALTCSFRAVDHEPIERAWLEVRLTTVRPQGSDEPVAWSLEPRALSDPVQISRTAKLDAGLKLISEVVPIEFGPSVSQERTHEYSMQVPYVEAHREGTARPSWIFSRTPVTEVRGVHRLRAVVELPAGGAGRAEVDAGATLRLKRFGLIPYRAELDDVPDQREVLLGA